jgi:hypothetical protein
MSVGSMTRLLAPPRQPIAQLGIEVANQTPAWEKSPSAPERGMRTKMNRAVVELSAKIL